MPPYRTPSVGEFLIEMYFKIELWFAGICMFATFASRRLFGRTLNGSGTLVVAGTELLAIMLLHVLLGRLLPYFKDPVFPPHSSGDTEDAVHSELPAFGGMIAQSIAENREWEERQGHFAASQHEKNPWRSGD